MKKLTLNLTLALLAIACVANAESSTNLTTVNQDSAETTRTAEKLRAQTERLTYANFRMVKRQIDFNFQRLNSISLPALQCHMSVDLVNRLFKRYAHEDAEQYLVNLKRNSAAATPATNAELAKRQDATSWPDPYIIGR